MGNATTPPSRKDANPEGADTLKAYIGCFSQSLSEVKRVILQALWQEGQLFPKNWVTSSELLKITRQKYFDRRIRELRDHQGCDIEVKIIKGEHAYRLRSSTILNANQRLYLSSAQKKELFESTDYVCSVCGAKMDPGIRGLQADHKVPLSRGGPHEFSNWQPICNDCNVGKRRACQNCQLDCQTCPWAFPEKVGLRTLVQLEPQLIAGLRRYANDHRCTPDSVVGDALRLFFKNKK